jgi:MoxR-like ATPase
MNEENPHSLPSPVFSAPPSVSAGSLERTMEFLQAMKQQVGQVFLGQAKVLEEVMSAFLAGGHVLLEGKPGLGKTHLVLALARSFGGTFRRIQFTPDLLPSDVTGHTLYDMKSQSFQTRHGPVFTNLLLADEINRAPAKTQAALLEVMQEEQVTIDGTTHKLQPPFMTLATQNPIEHEGTYPLPEAQLDRFMMKVLIDYPEAHHEESIVTAATSGTGAGALSIDQVQTVCTREDIIQARRHCAAILAAPEVVSYAVRIVRATRHSQGISLGAGTRGAISLIRAAKANALLQSRAFITPDDVKSAVLPVLRHRVMLAPELTISGQQIDDVLRALANTVEAPRQ